MQSHVHARQTSSTMCTTEKWFEMISYFTIDYKLFEKNADGTLVPFEKTRALYTANVVSKTADSAIARLKDDFHMLTVEVVNVSGKKEMTEQEYING